MEPATLSIVLEPRAEEIHEPDFSGYAPLVRFEAFLAAQRLFGWVRLDADRLTDLLNEHELLALTNVLVEERRDGATVLTDETHIPRSEIVAVVASGPRGDPSRRVDTRTSPVLVSAGDYRFGGLLHSRPGDDPADRFERGDAMIPLTDAWLEYPWGERSRRDSRATIILNRAEVTDLSILS